MADVVLFHSAHGLRPALRDAAARLRRAGHGVETPDLYAGLVAHTLTDALAIRDRIGREELLRRARGAVEAAAPGTVLAGLSLGASLAQRLAAADARFDRLLLLHGVAELPAVLPARWSVQAHLAADDPWEPRSEVEAWRRGLETLGAAVEVHFYAGGHLFTDPDLPDYEASSARLVWERAAQFLAGWPAEQGLSRPSFSSTPDPRGPCGSGPWS